MHQCSSHVNPKNPPRLVIDDTRTPRYLVVLGALPLPLPGYGCVDFGSDDRHAGGDEADVGETWNTKEVDLDDDVTKDVVIDLTLHLINVVVDLKLHLITTLPRRRDINI